MLFLHPNFPVYLTQLKRGLSFRKSFIKPIQPPLLSLNHHFKTNI